MLFVQPVAQTVDVGEAVRTHGAYVMRVLRHLGVGAADVEDVAQEVFLVLHRRAADWSPDRGSLRSWLYGICLRRAMHYRRTMARRSEVGEPEERAAPPTLDERQDARWLAGWILDHLDDDKRAVFVLFEVEGLRMKEVVSIVGCPLKTGYSRLEAARTIVQQARQQAEERGWI